MSTPSRQVGEIKIDCGAVYASTPALVNEMVNDVAVEEKMQGSKHKDSKSVSLMSIGRISFEESSTITDFSKLNRSDLAEPEQHAYLLSPAN